MNLFICIIEPCAESLQAVHTFVHNVGEPAGEKKATVQHGIILVRDVRQEVFDKFWK